MENVIGYLGAFCTTIAFLPQAIKVYKTKHTKDISLGMFLLLDIGMVIWLFYGLMITSLPVIISNSITTIFGLYILSMKIKLDVVPSLNKKKEFYFAKR